MADGIDMPLSPPHSAGMALTTGWTSGLPVATLANVTDNADGTYSVSYNMTQRDTNGRWFFMASLGTAGGLLATYWDADTTDTSVQGNPGTPTLTTSVDQPLDYSYAATPLSGLADSLYAARWRGLVAPTSAELYTFHLSLTNTAQERVRLWLSNELLVDSWTSMPTTTLSGTVSFTSSDGTGGRFDVALAYQAHAQPNGVKLEWESSTLTKRTIPSSRLYRDDPLSYSTWPTYDGDPTHVFLAPGGPAARYSLALGPATTVATAGDAATFTILSRDSSGNDRLTDSDMTFTAHLFGVNAASLVSATVLAASGAPSNDYDVSYTATRSQAYNVVVQYAVQHSSTSPFSLTVLPNALCATTSTAIGAGLSAAVASATSALTITARDAYANSKTQNGEGNGSGNIMAVRVVRSTTGEGPSPELYWDGSSTLSGSSRAASTLHGTLSATNDGRYPFTWTQDADTSKETYLHASWATVGGLHSTYYARAATGQWNMMNAGASQIKVLVDQQVNFASEAQQTANLFGTTLGGATAEWAVRWKGFVKPTSTGEYTFQVTMESSSIRERVRLWVDNSRLINEWGSLSATGAVFSQTFSIGTADLMYDLLMDYTLDPGNDNRQVILQYDCCATGSFAAIPSSNLFQAQDISGSPFRVYMS